MAMASCPCTSLAWIVALVAAPLPSLAAIWPSTGVPHGHALASHAEWPAQLHAAIAAAANAGAGPALSPAFRANLVSNSGTVVFSGSRGTYIRDAAKQRFRISTCTEISIFSPGQVMCMDQLSINISGAAPGFNMNMTVGQGPDAVCKLFPTPYQDMFGMLAMATRQGRGSVAGEPCELWQASATVPGATVNVSACIGADGVPRQYNQTTDLAYKALSSTFMTLSNVSVGEQPEEAFRPSEACRERWPTPSCPEEGTASLMLYRVRSPKEPSSLENRNLGDALGDMAFFCDLAGLDETQVVTSWSVQANASWGQYAYCLFRGGRNTCYSGTRGQVGRESALGLGRGRLQGQCSGNADVGSWFSMPAEGRCPDGAPLGREGCTWSARPLRTVSARCVVQDRGLKAMCAKERGHAPMLRSAAIFRAALASADASRGGCPDAGEVSVIV